MQVIDVDTHAVEPASVWDYLAKADEAHKPSILNKAAGAPIAASFANTTSTQYWVINNKIYGMHNPPGVAGASKGEITAGSITLDDIDARLAHMDAQRVDIHVVFSSLFLGLRIADKDAELALTRAYNRWLMERCKAAGGRLRWIMVPSLKNPEDTLKEMKWARRNGAVDVLFRGIEGFRYLDHSYFDPIYREAADLDLAICVHIGNGCPAFEEIKPRDSMSFNRFVADMPNYFAFSSLIRSDFPERFPNLRFGFFEAGCGWIPAVTEVSLHLRETPDGLKEIARDRIQRHNFYVTCELHEDLNYIAQFTGSDNLVIGSDYGHPHDVADTIQYRDVLDARDDLDSAFTSKLVVDNPHHLFNMQT